MAADAFAEDKQRVERGTGVSEVSCRDPSQVARRSQCFNTSFSKGNTVLIISPIPVNKNLKLH